MIFEADQLKLIFNVFNKLLESKEKRIIAILRGEDFTPTSREDSLTLWELFSLAEELSDILLQISSFLSDEPDFAQKQQIYTEKRTMYNSILLPRAEREKQDFI